MRLSKYRTQKNKTNIKDSNSQAQRVIYVFAEVYRRTYMIKAWQVDIHAMSVILLFISSIILPYFLPFLFYMPFISFLFNCDLFIIFQSLSNSFQLYSLFVLFFFRSLLSIRASRGPVSFASLLSSIPRFFHNHFTRANTRKFTHKCL